MTEGKKYTSNMKKKKIKNYYKFKILLHILLIILQNIFFL